jgi:flagellar biosynthesis protein
MQVDLDQHIPPQLYRAVAELLAWLYKLEAGVGLSLPHQLLQTNKSNKPASQAE